MPKITCPKCGVFIDTDGRLGEEELIDYWTADDGSFNWLCLDCEYEWVGDFEGKSSDTNCTTDEGAKE